MKKIGIIVGLLVLAVAAQFVPQVRRAEAYPYDTIRTLSRGAPGVPVLAALPAAGDGLCARATAGADVVVTCDAATPCYFRVVTSFGATDGGFPTVKGGNGAADGGFAAAGADNYLIAKTPTFFHLTGTVDSVCAVTADGGSLTVATLNP